MLNQVCIAGNLGHDPEVRYTPTGLAIANLNLAVNEYYKDADGERQKRTHWFRATAFGRTAEIAVEYLHKGSKVGIAGQLVQRSWQDQDGNNRYSVEIRINQLELMGATNGNGNGNDLEAPPESRSRNDSPARPPAAPPATPPTKPQPPRTNPPRQQRTSDAYEPPPEADIPF